MKYITGFLLILAVLLNAAPVEPARSTLFIMLDKGGKWNQTAAKTHLQNYILDFKGGVYSYGYGQTETVQSPMALAQNFTVLEAALSEWFQEQTAAAVSAAACGEAAMDSRLCHWLKTTANPSLENLKGARPDLLPSRYVVLAEGVSGMVTREYIQGENYRGDIDKVLFFNTPHEGSGFADQALFGLGGVNLAPKANKGLLATVIPLALLAYTGGTEALREPIMELAANIIVGMITSGKNPLEDMKESGLFDGLSVNDESLWYLAQDANIVDPKYQELFTEAQGKMRVAREKVSAVQNQIGGAKFLNSYEKFTDYTNPAFANIYSYGMPTIGNGRRMAGDYLEQGKAALSKAQTDKLLAREFANNVGNSLKSELQANFPNDWPQKYNEVRGDLETKFTLALDDVKKYDDLLSDEAIDAISNIDLEDLKNLDLGNIKDAVVNKLKNEIKSEVKKAAVKMIKENVVGPLLKELAKATIMEYIPADIMSYLGIIMQFVPADMKNQLMGSLGTEFSPEYPAMELAKSKCVQDAVKIAFGALKSGGDVSTDRYMDLLQGCVAEGMPSISAEMQNYGLNFFEQGTFDVPVHSAFGGNVKLFENSSVLRKGYALHEMDDAGAQILEYLKGVALAGALAKSRELVDLGLQVACSALSVYKPAEYVCNIARFAANTALLSEATSIVLKTTAKNGNLKQNGLLALKQSVKTGENGVSDMEEFLFAAPYIGLQTIQHNNKVIPLMLYAQSAEGASIPEISNFEQVAGVYAGRIEEWKEGNNNWGDADVIEKLFPSAYGPDQLHEINLNTPQGFRTLGMKKVDHEAENGRYVRRVARHDLGAFTVKGFIEEYRFQVDDLRPDELQEIKLDFNTREQFIYKRETDGWNVYHSTGGGDQTKFLTLSKSPVDANGLFVLRLKELIEAVDVTQNSVQEEGPNMVSVMLTNRLGLKSNQQFSFFYIATLPQIAEGWPRTLQYVSGLDSVFIGAGNLGNPYRFIADSTAVRLLTADSLDEVIAYAPVNVVQTKNESRPSDSIPGHEEWEQAWEFSAKLGHLLTQNNVPDGEYILQWQLITQDDTPLKNISKYYANTRIFLDRKAPEIAHRIVQPNLTNTLKDGVWASILNTDTTANRAIRAMRSFVLYDNNGARDTLMLLSRLNVGAAVTDIGWDEHVKKLPQGAVTLVTQAVDYAEPGVAASALLNGLQTSDSLSRHRAWNALFGTDTVFKPGINGSTVKSTVWIDTIAPSIHSVAFDAVRNTGAGAAGTEVCNSPECHPEPTERHPELVSGSKPVDPLLDPGSGAGSGTVFTLNAAHLLKLSFDIRDSVFNKDTAWVRVEITFTDSAQGLIRSYPHAQNLKDSVHSVHYVFNEPSAQKLQDGKYTVSVVLQDASGNKSGAFILNKTVVVDRTSPYIRDIMAVGGPVFATVGDVKNYAAYISQQSDYALNRSDLTCYHRVETDFESMDWVRIPGLETESKNAGGDVTFTVSLEGIAETFPAGRWYIQFGCYDAAGNFGLGNEVIGVGNRYPKITYPTSLTPEIIEIDLVQIEGFAPNPIVNNGNDAASEYKVEWRAAGGAQWNTAGIYQPDNLVNTNNRIVAIWDRTAQSAGEYEIKLSVRGCQNDSDPACNWVEAAERVTLGALESTVNKPKLEIVKPENGMQVPGDSSHTVSALLKGFTDLSEWTIDMRIYVASPQDSSKIIEAKQAHIDRARPAPFYGTPAVNTVLPAGLSLWQNENDVWELHWNGAAQADSNFEQPVIELKYLKNTFAFEGENPAPLFAGYVFEDSASVAEIKTGYFTIPAYNYTAAYDLSNVTDSLVLKFKTNAAFTVDLVSLDKRSRNTYCGGNLMPCFDIDFKTDRDSIEYYAERDTAEYDPDTLGFVPAAVYINPDAYRVKIDWNGLTSNENYPGGTTAMVKVTATENIMGGRVVRDSAYWQLAQAPVKIVSDIKGTGEFVIGRGENENENQVMTLGNGNFGYTFGITGRSALVSVEVLGANDTLVRQIWNDQPCVAANQPDLQKVSWNGINTQGHAVTAPGPYRIKVTAKDPDTRAHLDSISYPFDLKYAGLTNVAELPADSAASPYHFADLMMEEAKKEGDGIWRFTGVPDYLLKTTATAQYLPPGERDFIYRWGVGEGAVQYPAFYQANRFSLGIRRKRKKFPVTVVTMIATFGLRVNDMTYDCEETDRRTMFKVSVHSLEFDLDQGGIIDLNAILNAGGSSILAYNTNGSNKSYPIMVGVKVFPASSDSIIVADYLDGRREKEFSINGAITTNRWNEFWNSEGIDDNLDAWRLGYEQPILWSASNKDVVHNGGTYYPIFGEDASLYQNENCEDKEDFVCGPAKAEDETRESIESFNPHSNMLTMAVIPALNNNTSYGNASYNNGVGDCAAWNGSHQDIHAILRLTVNESYWNPKFGYSNLANRYTRFDHTNKTLYDPNNYFASDPGLLNLFDGTQWVHSPNYGLVTAFETQRFIMNNTSANPLLFADELNTNIHYPSNFSYRFFGPAGTNTSIAYQLLARNKNSAEPMHGSAMSHNSSAPGYFGNVNYYTPYVTDMEFYVAPVFTPDVGAKTHERFTAPFPADTNWVPGTIPEIPWCESVDPRSVNGYEQTCYKYYRGASRLRYGVGAWVDSDWVNTFTNYAVEYLDPVFGTAIKNPVSEGEPSRFAAIPELNQVWNPAASVALWDTVTAASADFNADRWAISPRRLNKRYVNDTTTVFGIRSPDFTPVLEQYNAGSRWVVEFDTDSSITNTGELKGANDTLVYIRSQDTTKHTDAHIVLGGVEPIAPKRIFSQNSDREMVRILDTAAAWLKNIRFTHADLRTRSDSAHLYFSAAPDSEGAQIAVTRTNNNPGKRAEEMVMLRGRVPGAGTKYTLSYLKNGSLFTLLSGTQTEAPSEVLPYPVEYLQNVNKLQGNTSYFLTFGGAGNENVFFKQLDVRVGAAVDNTKDTLVQSMYRNVSVLFPQGAFELPTDVTVRTASLGDYGGYTAFRGFDPVGVVLEVLPHAVFPDTAQPQVSIWLSKADIQGKNPLNIKVYKPDSVRRELVLLDRQEMGFYDRDKSPITGFDLCTESAPCSNYPLGFEFIKVSGRTSSFSMFMLLDSEEAAKANDRLKEPEVEFACSDSLHRDTTLWMGTYNGYLQYPYPCNGRASYLLQLRHGSEVVKESQGSTAEDIIWNARRGDIATAIDSFTSRLAVFEPNGHSRQMPGPFVRIDSIPPEILEFDLSVSDLGTDKRVTVETNVADTGSGVAMVNIHYYFAGRLVKLDAFAGDTVIASEWVLGKEDQASCIGCKVQVQITVQDAGHNYVKSSTYTESLYPYPVSLALWYPLSEGSGTVSREILGSGMDLHLNMDNPWLYGTSVYLQWATDQASASKEWTRSGTSPLSVEFTFRGESGPRRPGSESVLLSWSGAVPWRIGLTDGENLYFESNSSRVTIPHSLASAKTNAHYVFTVEENQVKLYRDGALFGSGTLGQAFVWNAQGKPHLGRQGNLPSAGGDISALRLYTSALTAEQVEDLHDGFLNIDETDFVVVRAADLQEHPGLTLDQSCDLPGYAFLKQQSANETGTMTWNVNAGSGTYRLFVYSRGTPGQNAGVEVYLNGTSRGIYPVSAKGVFESNELTGLSLSLSSGAQSIKIRPLGQTGIAALALAPGGKNIPASQVKWGEGRWQTPAPVVNVEMYYQNFADKSWVRPQFRFSNTTGNDLHGVKLRYYYRGEGADVQAKVFYPDAPMSIHADAADVYYAEFALTEALPAYGSPYWANGPQMGLHRTDYSSWYSEDDPSFEANGIATNGSFIVSDKVALLDAGGNLLNSWSCFEAGGGVKEPVLPKVRALAKDTKGTSNQSSLIHLAVENTGTVALRGFESRYYFRSDNGKEPALNVYYSPNAEAQLVKVNETLYYVSFINANQILNPGEISENGNGVQFELYNSDWSLSWDAGNDPSRFGIGVESLQPADSVAVFDLQGNLLWGNLPQSAAPVVALHSSGGTQCHPEQHLLHPEQFLLCHPALDAGSKPEDHPEFGPGSNKLLMDSEGVTVRIDTDAVYVLEVVNAAGIPLQTLFSGHLAVGEHYIGTRNVTLDRGNYLVLRRGNTIISRVLIP